MVNNQTKPITTTSPLAHKKSLRDINSIRLVGRLTKDVVLREPRPGLTVATLRIAVDTPVDASPSFSDSMGEDEVCYIDIVVWNHEAIHWNGVLCKGSKIIVDGRLKFEEWLDKATGEKRSKHVIAPDIIEVIE